MTDEEIKYLSRSECATLLHSDKGYGGLSSAEFWEEGYKKGLAEGKPKWHDLRENPNDLPKESGEYWCKWEDGTYCTAHYFEVGGFCDCTIAWCELPILEESESTSKEELQLNLKSKNDLVEELTMQIESLKAQVESMKETLSEISEYADEKPIHNIAQNELDKWEKAE